MIWGYARSGGFQVTHAPNWYQVFVVYFPVGEYVDPLKPLLWNLVDCVNIQLNLPAPPLKLVTMPVFYSHGGEG